LQHVLSRGTERYLRSASHTSEVDGRPGHLPAGTRSCLACRPPTSTHKSGSDCIVYMDKFMSPCASRKCATPGATPGRQLDPTAGTSSSRQHAPYNLSAYKDDSILGQRSGADLVFGTACIHVFESAAPKCCGLYVPVHPDVQHVPACNSHSTGDSINHFCQASQAHTWIAAAHACCDLPYMAHRSW
jgi:hypothetical protein